MKFAVNSNVLLFDIGGERGDIPGTPPPFLMSCDVMVDHVTMQYVREVFRLLGDDMAYSELGEQALDYALQWIRFVLDKCDRGRGTRPRYCNRKCGSTSGLKITV